MPSSHLILCRPLLLLPPIPPSIRVFSNESTLRIRWPKCWSFSFSISPFKEHPGLISFRMGWLDLLAVQGTLKSLLQQHSSKASILRLTQTYPGTNTLGEYTRMWVPEVRDHWGLSWGLTTQLNFTLLSLLPKFIDLLRGYKVQLYPYSITGEFRGPGASNLPLKENPME